MKNTNFKIKDRIGNDSIGKISCEIIHNILNPINGLILYLEMNKENESINNLISPISLANDKIRDFIRDLSNGFENQRQQEIVNLENHIVDILEIMKPKSLGHNVSLNFIRKYDVNLIIANPLKIYQVFINLISNSLDAFEKVSDSRKKVINIIIESDYDYNLLIKIYDNGCGIERENLKRIFDNSFSTKDKGSGIGLHNTRKIIENHLGGNIKAKSTINEYTVFTIKIPKVRLVI
jgi:signal transduction histidine kinase